MSTTEEPTPAPEPEEAPTEEESEGQPLPEAAEENLIPESTFDPATGQQLPVEVADQEESAEEESADE